MKSRSPGMAFIFVTILLDALGIGLLVPIMPDVIRRFSQDPLFVNQYYGYFISIYALMQFAASPVLGSLSDRFGRRSILLVSLLGAGLDYILMAFAPTLGWLFAGRVISGLTGASMTVASSYIADISTEENRSANFGMIGAAWGLGFIIGPMLGGVVGSYGHTLPFLLAAGLNLLNFAFGLFILPESLPPEKRGAMDVRRFNPFHSLFNVLRSSPVLSLIASYALLFMAGQVLPSIWVLFTQYKFNWTTFDVGLSLTCVGVSIAIVQGGLTRLIVPRLGERKTLIVGVTLSCIILTLFGCANYAWMMYVLIALYALAGVSNPALQSMITANTPSSGQGELQGSLMSIASLTSILGPLLYTELFAFSTHEGAQFKIPGMPFFTAAAFCLCAWLIILAKKTTIPSSLRTDKPTDSPATI